MNPTTRLLHRCRITLFTRNNCSLCENAKLALSDAWDLRPFDYQEINIMNPKYKRWRDVYEFDSPVIHINLSDSDMEREYGGSLPMKLMHHIRTQDIVIKIDQLLKKDDPTN